MIFRGDVDGVFAITPIVNYLLASLGFFFLFCWAIRHGMFRDIERPKYTMLENRAEARPGRRRRHGVVLRTQEGNRGALPRL